MRIADKDRGANVRRNLRRWWKPLLLMTVGWIVLTVVVCIGAIMYAHGHNLSQRRVQMLGEGCGAIMSVALIVAWLIVFLIADRKKLE
jgi:hypothetical protein